MWKLSRQIKREIKQYKPYTNIEFCPFWNFFKVIETGDTRYLIKDIDYESLPVLSINFNEAYEELSYQYNEANDSVKHNIERSKIQKLQELKLQMTIIANCITILSSNYDKEIKDIAAIFYPKVSQLHGNKALEYLLSQLKGLKTKYNIKSKEIEILNENKKDEKVDLYEIINAIEQYKGFNIDAHQLTVKKFITLQKNFDKWSKAKQNELEKYKNNERRHS